MPHSTDRPTHSPATYDPSPEETGAPRTGHESLDGVVEAVAALRNAPVEEHVSVLESAHEGLRRALDQPW